MPFAQNEISMVNKVSMAERLSLCDFKDHW